MEGKADQQVNEVNEDISESDNVTGKTAGGRVRFGLGGQGGPCCAPGTARKAGWLEHRERELSARTSERQEDRPHEAVAAEMKASRSEGE